MRYAILIGLLLGCGGGAADTGATVVTTSTAALQPVHDIGHTLCTAALRGAIAACRGVEGSDRACAQAAGEKIIAACDPLHAAARDVKRSQEVLMASLDAVDQCKGTVPRGDIATCGWKAMGAVTAARKRLESSQAQWQQALEQVERVLGED